MRNRVLLALCCVYFWSKDVSADIENEIKRGVFPFMAILYYPDEAVVDSTGARFVHAAVLIRPQWLISSAIDHSVMDNVPLGFPRKTLIARAGAMTLDASLTFKEDEDEQEREVIQIVRPTIHEQEAWWFTDITLLQTLLPFKLTASVAPTTIAPKKDYADKSCIILVYAKRFGIGSDEKVLMQMAVELLAPSMDTCGPQISNTTMTCASNAEKNAYDTEFCQGNSGGPLLCEGEVMALQTYIENNCKSPHLYQLLDPWESFLTCGTEEKCNTSDTCNICVATHKDMPSTNYALSTNIGDTELFTESTTRLNSNAETETTAGISVTEFSIGTEPETTTGDQSITQFRSGVEQNADTEASSTSRQTSSTETETITDSPTTVVYESDSETKSNTDVPPSAMYESDTEVKPNTSVELKSDAEESSNTESSSLINESDSETKIEKRVSSEMYESDIEIKTTTESPSPTNESDTEAKVTTGSPEIEESNSETNATTETSTSDSEAKKSTKPPPSVMYLSYNATETTAVPSSSVNQSNGEESVNAEANRDKIKGWANVVLQSNEDSSSTSPLNDKSAELNEKKVEFSRVASVISNNSLVFAMLVLAFLK